MKIRIEHCNVRQGFMHELLKLSKSPRIIFTVYFIVLQVTHCQVRLYVVRNIIEQKY